MFRTRPRPRIRPAVEAGRTGDRAPARPDSPAPPAQAYGDVDGAAQGAVPTYARSEA